MSWAGTEGTLTSAEVGAVEGKGSCFFNLCEIFLQ